MTQHRHPDKDDRPKGTEPGAVGEAGRAKLPGRDETRPLPKRFYTSATAEANDDGWRVLLDGRPVKTPAKRDLALPSKRVADAVAAEFAGQGAVIDPATMPLTRIVNSALDGVAPRMAEVAADVAKYAGSDLVCYRADAPQALVALQARHWDPVIAWAERALGVRLALAAGVMPVTQAAAVPARVLERLASLDPLRLAAVHVVTTLTGSALLALALAEGEMSPAAVWAAAHVDEDWQISQWGEDAEAAARRALRRREFDAAAGLLEGAAS